MLLGSQKSSLPGVYIEVLGRLRQQSGQQQLCFRAHLIDALGHILLAGGGKPFFSRLCLQG